MDRVLPGLSLDRERYRLMSAACLLIAGKYEEEEANLPARRFSPVSRRLVHRRNAGTGRDNVVGKVALVLHCNHAAVLLGSLLFTGEGFCGPVFLGGSVDLDRLPPVVAQSVAFHDDTMNGLPLPSKTPRKIREFCEFFMDLTVQDYSFARYSPSLIAAAVLVASRRALNIVYVCPVLFSSGVGCDAADGCTYCPGRCGMLHCSPSCRTTTTSWCRVWNTFGAAMQRLTLKLRRNVRPNAPLLSLNWTPHLAFRSCSVLRHVAFASFPFQLLFDFMLCGQPAVGARLWRAVCWQEVLGLVDCT
jgi:hypothetical protein